MESGQDGLGGNMRFSFYLAVFSTVLFSGCASSSSRQSDITSPLGELSSEDGNLVSADDAIENSRIRERGPSSIH